jgi:hypothetical protein
MVGGIMTGVEHYGTIFADRVHRLECHEGFSICRLEDCEWLATAKNIIRETP